MGGAIVQPHGSVAYQAFLMLLCLMGVSLLFAWRFRLRFTAAPGSLIGSCVAVALARLPHWR